MLNHLNIEKYGNTSTPSKRYNAMKVVNTVDEVCLYTPNWAFALQEFRPYVFLTYIWPSSKILNKKEA